MSGGLAGALRERITIERTGTERSASGLQVSSWETVATCRAHVRPEGAGPESEAMSLSAMARFRVTIRMREGIEVGQRVRWKGRVMTIRQLIENPDLRDRLELRCEEVRA